MTEEPSKRTPELLPELGSWEPRSREILLRTLVAYAEQQYHAAGQPHGERAEDLLRWLANQLMKNVPRNGG
jgi:hypothetical protein